MLRKHDACRGPALRTIDLKRFELEAPPGFEPGMEVLQTYAASLSDAISRSQPGSWFQLALFWSTNLSLPSSIVRK